MEEYNDKLIVINLELVRDNLATILKNKIPLWRKNKNNQFVIIPLERLEQYIGASKDNIVFYIEDKWESLIKSKIEEPKVEAASSHSFSWVDNDGEIDPYSERRKMYLEMSSEEREEHYDYLIRTLKEIELPKRVIDVSALVNIINTISDGYAITKTSFDDLADNEKQISPEHIKRIVFYTTTLVKNIMDTISKNQAANNFINLLGEKSTGSTIDHMNSVFLIFVSFCYYYNSYFSEGKIAKIRAQYKDRFAKHYKTLLPDNPPESLEDVFKGGMRELDGEILLQLGLGAFLHDIGKVDNIDYFEGSEKYDRKIIMRHAPVSYNMIIKTREFDRIVAYLAALHHEYYNDKSGYGLSRLLFPDNTKKIKDPLYCLAFDLDEVKNGYAIGYVPAKMLEIVDVFDALTDKNRKYREREFSIDEAIVIMKNDFIEKSVKLDPILFSIFIEFISSYAVLKDKEAILNIFKK